MFIFDHVIIIYCIVSYHVTLYAIVKEVVGKLGFICVLGFLYVPDYGGDELGCTGRLDFWFLGNWSFSCSCTQWEIFSILFYMIYRIYMLYTIFYMFILIDLLYTVYEMKSLQCFPSLFEA